jgi:hypothetical protein
MLRLILYTELKGALLKQNRQKSTSQKSSQKGTVQVAVWKDSAEIVKAQDVFTNYSSDTFYDFVRPLKVLEGSGWSSMIKAKSDDEGFFVFSAEDKPLY